MFATLLALAAGGQAAPAQSPPATTPPATSAMTNQQRFDAATAAAEAGRCAEAIAGFDALAAAPAFKRNAMLAAAVDARRGGCLIRLGRAAEGTAAIRRGLPVLEAKGTDFAIDVRDARVALGNVAAAAFDYAAAADEYRAAAKVSEGAARITPLMRLASVTMFDRDGAALAAAEEARRIALATPDLNKKSLAAVQTQYARVLLNEGRATDAYRELKNSLQKQGGLTTRVSLDDIATRSDLAIAALRDGRPDDARLYLAYTGAGRAKDAPLTRAANMSPPACGEAGLSPDDVAIVQFTLEADGHVSGVYPIFATGGRQAAVAFARAVQDWSWRADDAAKVPPFFRQATRVELRCTKAVAGGDLIDPLRAAATAWLDERAGPAPWADLSDAAAAPLQRATLDRARTAGDQAGTALAALALATNSVVDKDEAAPLLETAAAAASAVRAPAAVQNYVALRQAGLSKHWGEPDIRGTWRALLARPEFANDPLSAATLRLMIAEAQGKAPPPPDALALQKAVADDPALPANHPLRVAALLGQANVLTASGDAAGARAAFARTGLTREQCAQLGLTPNMQSSGASADDYPMAAARMGFEGWVLAEADVQPDGRTVAQRAVVAYPPFVFADAAVGIAKSARYSSSFRPEGTLACQGTRLPILFRM